MPALDVPLGVRRWRQQLIADRCNPNDYDDDNNDNDDLDNNDHDHNPGAAPDDAAVADL